VRQRYELKMSDVIASGTVGAARLGVAFLKGINERLGVIKNGFFVGSVATLESNAVGGDN
jgi:hypothetical protein